MYVVHVHIYCDFGRVGIIIDVRYPSIKFQIAALGGDRNSELCAEDLRIGCETGWIDSMDDDASPDVLETGESLLIYMRMTL